MNSGTRLAAMAIGFVALVSVATTAWLAIPSAPAAGTNPPVKVVDSVPPEAEDTISPPVSPTGPFPKAVFDLTEYDFGVAAQGSSQSHEFIVHNQGESPLRILVREEDSSCQCTVGEVSDNGDILPGKSATVTLKWDMKVATPHYRHFALVRTNDPNNRKIELVVAGRVEEMFKVTPQDEWELGTIGRDVPAEKTGYIFSAVREHMETPTFLVKDPQIEVAAEPMTPEELTARSAKSGYRVTARIKPSNVDQVVRAPVLGELRFPDDETTHTFDFLVLGKTASPFQINGIGWRPEANAVMMGNFPADKGKTAKLFIYINNWDGELKLESAEQTFNAVQIEFSKDEKFKRANSQRYMLSITVPPGEPIDRHFSKSEKINLKFNHPHIQEMRIYVDYHSL